MLQRHRREISLIAAILAIGVVLAVAAPGFFTFSNQESIRGFEPLTSRMVTWRSAI